MSYANQTTQAVRETGTIIRSANGRLNQMERINERLESILASLRQAPPHGVTGVERGPEPQRPLADQMDRLERAQDRTNDLLSEIESFIG